MYVFIYQIIVIVSKRVFYFPTDTQNSKQSKRAENDGGDGEPTQLFDLI